ncbi:MAG TPA: GAF and ANTAR domain-containing protein [Acidimicrobiia bacterium]|jgi:GAF domain-containing protein|nr:GAF and ANTAR domain-containing protein [Acidimicrobiia bacterium]
MAREDRLVETLVTLADTLVDQYDIIDFLQTLAERCVDLVDVSAAGIMLADPQRELRHAACSNEQMRLVELFELQVEEGPCFDAFRTQAPVVCDSLEEAAQRWPEFTRNANESGFAAFSAVPMRLRDTVVGALNLFSGDAHALGVDDIKVVQAMADIATIGILQERSIRDAHAFSTQLELALESRVVIEQAKGIVAERNHMSVDDAFDQIRRFARAHNRLLSETARQIIDGSLQVDALTALEPEVPKSSHKQ